MFHSMAFLYQNYVTFIHDVFLICVVILGLDFKEWDGVSSHIWNQQTNVCHCNNKLTKYHCWICFCFSAKGAAVPPPEPTTDTNLLVTRCCGLNKFIDGEDPEIKADDEYPEWWACVAYVYIHIRNSKLVKQYLDLTPRYFHKAIFVVWNVPIKQRTMKVPKYFKKTW